ncbi:hypothetical protein Pmani_000125 [Petrolisthes manimaculis]|uniref:Uncharacterized protein n=1 Tax=Petrolisthes manimaculis TaxID=1843537 RepID=A0AAE1QNI0_9EUCA|nr:hypothetical protein Pmani_000125 [Petrolisthes manimaculis]
MQAAHENDKHALKWATEFQAAHKYLIAVYITLALKACHSFLSSETDGYGVGEKLTRGMVGEKEVGIMMGKGHSREEFMDREVEVIKGKREE